MSLRWIANPDLYPRYIWQWSQRGRGNRGMGEGLEYNSWFAVRDVPSDGTAGDIAGIKVPRPFVTLSTLEATQLFKIERRKNILDIRENWPILHMDRTRELCREHRVRHVYRGRYLFPFTIDFLITELLNGRISYSAESVKTPDKAADPEALLRLLIEELWCREHNIPWSLVDTSEYTPAMLSALRFMRAWFQYEYEPNGEDEPRFAKYFLADYSRNVPLSILVRKTAKALRLSEPMAKSMFRFCAWSDLIPVSIKRPLAFNLPVIFRKDNENVA